MFIIAQTDEGKNEYQVLVKGYDVTITETEDPSVYNVTLLEGGDYAYNVDVPITLEGDELLFEDIVNFAAEAAIDFFEAERGTLGQGAESLEVTAMHKKSCYMLYTSKAEEWFRRVKTTGFEEQVVELMNMNMSLTEELIGMKEEQAALELDLQRAYLKLDKLNWDRIVKSDLSTTTIIINAKKIACLEDVSNIIAAFKGHALEASVLDTLQSIITIKDALYEASSYASDVENLLDENDRLIQHFVLQAEQQRVVEVEDNPMVKYPETTKQIMDLMEGFEIDPIEETYIAGVTAHKQAFEDVEQEVIELPQRPGGFDLVLDEDEDPPHVFTTYNVGENVALKKKFVQDLWGGIKKEWPKGTKGKVDTLYDRQGNYYLLDFDGRIVRVPEDHIKKA